MKSIAIIILNWNGKENTLTCLKSIFAGEVVFIQSNLVIVVDNGSTDGSVDAIRKEFPEITILVNKKNLGFAEGNNVGIRHALKQKAKYIFLLNNDTILSKQTIINLYKALQEHKQWGFISPKIYFSHGREFHQNRYAKSEQGSVIWYAGGVIDWKTIYGYHRGVDEIDNGQYDIEGETGFATGCAMIVRKEVFEEVGLFNALYFLYYEDLDINVRARRKKWSAGYCPKSVIWHNNAGSGGGSGSMLQDYYISRNRLLFGMKYAHLNTKVALIKESVHMLVNGRLWQRKGVKDFYLRKFGRGSYVSNRSYSD